MLAVCTTVFIADVRKAIPVKEIKGEKGKKRARSGSDGSSSSDDDSSTDSDEDDEGFVPDLLIDGFPYHIRENQIMLFASRCGTPVMIRMSVDDRSGAFTGAVLVRMSSLEETLKLSEKVHDSVFQGHKLVCGVLNQSMELVSLKDGDEVLVPAPQDFYADGGVRVLTHERLWV
ncbi:hypothetical protein AGDE_16328 [Angomonas deanei]|uniref:RNA recognition motif. (A.k.a. RRM, RBD, or RNP domain) n=1 Tax=Angomonas deanei TaxID=59799 RepID=A0A7G2C856_9TRYP|nr:hypothetical protein AGDE_16328 [Angomonas deanei]CAD2215988.1 hypothetical protein, conserved [Angomonas deanei]|eukprot:EPY17296.1 hypothetical protein AGDE_16328 [Angomonas deanei]